MNLDIFTDGKLGETVDPPSGRLRVNSVAALRAESLLSGAFQPALLPDTELDIGPEVASSRATPAIEPILFPDILAAGLPQEPASNAPLEVLATAPNDPFFNSQFGLTEVGALEAREILLPRGEAIDADPVVVAVIDTGIDYTHPDLADNLFTNDLEANGIPGVDDDNNGFVDDIVGYDFVDEDGDPFDENSHGTAVAGVIAAVPDNGIGVAGIAGDFDVEILALRALGADGSGTLTDVAESIVYAVDNGADVINLSLGGEGFSSSLANALAYAEANDVLVVAAAGNAGQNNDLIPTYPASFGFDNLLSVAATDRNGRLASFSNFGATSVDLGAPGADIATTFPNGQVGSISGTSFAAPLVAGAAAALLASLPDTVASPTETVIDLLLDTVAPAANLQGDVVTGGILDFAAAAEALVAAFPAGTAPVPGDDTLTLEEDTVAVLAPLTNDTGDGLTVTSFTAASSGTVAANGDGTFTYTPDANFAGSDSFTYTVTDGNGKSATATVNLTIAPVNDGPTAVGDTTQTPAGTPLAIAAGDLLANDSDVEGDALEILAVGNATGGSATLDPAGEIAFVPAAGFTGEASFDYTIADGNGGTATATVTVAVLAPTEPELSAADAPGATGDDFDPGIDGNFWAEIGNAVANANFGGDGNGLFFTGGDRDDASRLATTRPLDVSAGGKLEFDFIFGTGSNGGENADVGEDVSLSYSTDGGQTWVEFALYTTEGFASFTTVAEVIPVAAQTSATQFRFQQVRHSGGDFDNFGLDNVTVLNDSSLAALADPVTGAREDFNTGLDGSLWAEISNGTPDNAFGGSGDSLFFTGGTRGDRSRFAVTTGIDVADGGTVTFDLIFGNGRNGGERADLGEDVALDYSIDGGQTWQQLGLYSAQDFTTFTTVDVDLPAAAHSAGTQFRWQQVRHSGGSQDNFGLDNISIQAS